MLRNFFKIHFVSIIALLFFLSKSYAWGPIGDIRRGIEHNTKQIRDHVAKPIADGIEHNTKQIRDHVAKPIADGIEHNTKQVRDHVAKPIADGIEHTSEQINDHVIAPIDKAILKPVRDGAGNVAEWVKENPEDAIIIASIAAVSWAACVDGCTVVGSILIDGTTSGSAAGTAVAIPLVTAKIGGNNDQDRDNNIKTSETAQVQEKELQKTNEKKSPESNKIEHNSTEEEISNDYSQEVRLLEMKDKPPIEEQYPHKYSKSNYPKGLKDKIPVIVYRSLDERLVDIFNEFSVPCQNCLVRLPDQDTDPAGGTFLSPRKTDDIDVVAAYGNNARRIHGATDFLIGPGQFVCAPLTGRVEAIWKTKTGFNAINIRSQDGTLARVLYVYPDDNIKIGTEVRAGKTILGQADNLLKSESYKNVPNHIHVDFIDYKKRRFDPWSNKVTEPILSKK